MSRVGFLAIVMAVILAGMLYAQGLPFMMYGRVYRHDGTVVPAECLRFKAFLNASPETLRYPEDTVNHKTGYDINTSSWFAVFDTANHGRLFVVKFYDNCNDEFGFDSATIDLSLGAGQNCGITFLSRLNHPPEIVSTALVVSPAGLPREGSTITCIYEAYDPDFDPISVTYDWYVNGELQSVHENFLTGEYFDKGDEVWCVVTPYDGYDFGDPSETGILTIHNTPPDEPVIDISPDAPFSFEDISAEVVVMPADPDGDVLFFEYEWYLGGVSGEPVFTGDILPNSLTVTGQRWVLRVRAYDLEDYSDWVGLAFDIGGPSFTNGNVEPAGGHPGTQIFTFSVTYTNPRNYQPGGIYVYIDGTPYGLSPLNPEDNNYTDGAVFVYRTTLGWGEHSFWFGGRDIMSNEIVGEEYSHSGPIMTNTPPVVLEAHIFPPQPNELTPITVSVVTYGDDDGDPVEFNFRWFNQNGPVGGNTAMLSPEYFKRGDEIWCVITPFDGYEYGVPFETGHIVAVNTPPTIASVWITTTPSGPATELSTLWANISANDLDNDGLTFSYYWYVNGELLSIPAELNHIDGLYFNRGDQVFVLVVASDGFVTSQGYSSAVTISNTAPTITHFELGPESPTGLDNLVANYSATDVDGDALSYSVVWYLNGNPLYTGNVLPADYTSHFDVWVAQLTVNDGAGGIATAYDTVRIANIPPEILGVANTMALAGATYIAPINARDLDGDVISYSLSGAPSGMSIVDGNIVWNVPAHTSATSYNIVVRATDGFGSDAYEFTLWVYPVSNELFAPTNLVALDGFSGFIPLLWDAPEIFEHFTNLPLSFVGYAVYRRTGPDGVWERIATVPTAEFVDYTVIDYTMYYYYVTAVYNVGESSPSNTVSAFSGVSDPNTWFSPYTYLPPTVDGSIHPYEWSDATRLTFNEMPPFPVVIYVKHTTSYLYIAAEVFVDNAVNPNDMFMVSVDDNFNRGWPAASPSGEGEYRLTNEATGASATFQGIWGLFPGGIGRDVRTTASGLVGGISNESGYVTYEFAIPIGTEYYAINVDGLGRKIGIRFAIYDATGYVWHLVAPAGSDPENPAQFGSLYLQRGAPQGTLCFEPTEISVSVRRGETACRTLRIGNCSNSGYLSFTLREGCAFDIAKQYDPGEILVYADGTSLVPQALDHLGYAYTLVSNSGDFVEAIAEGGWQLVVFSSNYAVNTSVWDAIANAASDGANIIIQCPDLDAVASHPFWGQVGVVIGEDLGNRGSALTWDAPAHPFFHTPMEVPPSIERIIGSYSDYGDCMIPSGASVIASFDLYPYPINGALAVSSDGNIIVNSFILSDINDTDEDGILDGVELLINEISYTVQCTDVPWLTLSSSGGLLAPRQTGLVNVCFDATELEPGEYSGYVIIRSNDPTNPESAILCRLIVTEPEVRILTLRFPSENVYAGPNQTVDVPIWVGSLEGMNITRISLNVTANSSVAQPISVTSAMGSVVISDVGPGYMVFTVSSPSAMLGNGYLAVVRFRVNPLANLGSATTLGISGVNYNPDAYVTGVVTQPGYLVVVGGEADWSVRLTFTNPDRLVDIVNIGANLYATNAFDPEFDVENAPAEFDAYSDISEYDPVHPHLSTDIRNSNDNMIVWNIYGGENGGKVEWAFRENDTLTSMGTLLLVCGSDVVDMKTASVYYYDAGENIRIIYSRLGYVPFTFRLLAGYNLVSLPVYVDDGRVSTLFPMAMGCWYFDNSIQNWMETTTLVPGVGYVVLYPRNATITVWGRPVSNLTLYLGPGWNLIGTTYGTVDFSSPSVQPPMSLISFPEYAFYYDPVIGNYFLTNTLVAGNSYFVAAIRNCVLTLPGSGGSGKSSASKVDWIGKIEVNGSSVEVAGGENDGFLPIPPSITGEQPDLYFDLGLWKASRVIGNGNGSWNLVVKDGGKLSLDIPEGVSIWIDGVRAQNGMYLSGGLHKVEVLALPRKFEITRAFPNPFNASVSIALAVPDENPLSVVIYDMTGKTVRTLVEGSMEPGYHTLVWDGTDNCGNNVSTGVYFCKMFAGGSSQVVRLVLTK